MPAKSFIKGLAQLLAQQTQGTNMPLQGVNLWGALPNLSTSTETPVGPIEPPQSMSVPSELGELYRRVYETESPPQTQENPPTPSMVLDPQKQFSILSQVENTINSGADNPYMAHQLRAGVAKQLISKGMDPMVVGMWASGGGFSNPRFAQLAMGGQQEQIDPVQQAAQIDEIRTRNDLMFKMLTDSKVAEKLKLTKGLPRFKKINPDAVKTFLDDFFKKSKKDNEELDPNDPLAIAKRRHGVE